MFLKSIYTTLFLSVFSTMTLSADFSKGRVAYENGDFQIALREWLPLAEGGNSKAQYALGWMYERKLLQYVAAIKWYTLAAEQGDANAQTHLCWLYENGIGVPKNYKTAFKWCLQAAQQGYHLAQFNVGMFYDDGRGISENNSIAARWYLLAAEQGHAVAQGNLGVLYAFGDGVPKDYILAHMWGNIAAANGNDRGAKLRDDFESMMTSRQIEKALSLARECISKNYQGC